MAIRRKRKRRARSQRRSMRKRRRRFRRKRRPSGSVITWKKFNTRHFNQNQQYRKMVFYTELSYSATMSAQNKFKLNSIFQCDATANTGEPYGAAMMALQYSKCKILGAHIKVKCLNTDTSNNSLYEFIVAANDTGTFDSVSDLHESGKAKWVYVKDMVSGDSIKTLKHYMGSAKVVGSRLSADDAAYECTPVSDPSNVLYWTLQIDPIATASITSKAYVTITYYVKFWDQIIPIA